MHNCTECGKPVCNFCTVPACKEDEMKRKHKIGDMRCNIQKKRSHKDHENQFSGILPNKISNLSPKENYTKSKNTTDGLERTNIKTSIENPSDDGLDSEIKLLESRIKNYKATIKKIKGENYKCKKQ